MVWTRRNLLLGTLAGVTMRSSSAARPSGGGPMADQVILAILAGQSNMNGRTPNDGLNVNRPNKLALVGDDQRPNYLSVVSDTTVLHHPEHLDRTGPDDQLLDEIALANPGAVVLGVPCCVGGSGFTPRSGGTWVAGPSAGASGRDFEGMLARVASAVSGVRARNPGAKIMPHLYLQNGENECNAAVPRATVAAALGDLIRLSRSRLAASTGVAAFSRMPAIIGLPCVENWHPAATVNPKPAWQAVVAGMVDAARKNPACYLVASKVPTAAPDLLHWSPAAKAREQGHQHAVAMARTDVPKITTNAGQGSVLGQPLSVMLRHDAEDDPGQLATWHLVGGPNANLFELTDHYVNPAIRWVGNGTGPSAEGSYQVQVALNNSAGAQGAPFAISVEVAKRKAVPVALVQTYHNTAFNTAYGKFSLVDVPIKAGLNLFYFFAGAGPNKDAGFQMQVNGNACTKVQGAPTGANQQLWSYVSAIDTTATVSASWRDNAFANAVLLCAVLEGVEAKPMATDVLAWSNAPIAGSYGTAAMTCPPGGIIVGFGVFGHVALKPVSPTRKTYASGASGVILERRTNGPLQWTSVNGAQWRGMISAAFAPG